ncbi:hypothetical protein SCMU_21080 [Sinomonas cyclohexanicum]|uniref:Uncharacterized protein n=1 Tax=Sinomonas cyclohexanicum TaxID=322009 RepID=A0ABN6FHJ7_SINCY|nr:hypothetical protein SCMU_21080 [Corynebacterium cyclohexanicum]
MAGEENGFLEYLQLQGSEPDLVTKSELLAAVRRRGYSIGERQLSFYVSEGIVPKSVRVGSRAGAYPRIVVELLAWVAGARDGGLAVDTIRELLPVWKLLIRARNAKRLDLAELEYVARQQVSSLEGSLAIPAVVTDVLHVCGKCHACADVVVILKDGSEKMLASYDTTLGFAIARRVDVEANGSDESSGRPVWFARTRITLAINDKDVKTDPTTIILGLRPNEALPEDDDVADTDSDAALSAEAAKGD